MKYNTGGKYYVRFSFLFGFPSLIHSLFIRTKFIITLRLKVAEI